MGFELWIEVNFAIGMKYLKSFDVSKPAVEDKYLWGFG